METETHSRSENLTPVVLAAVLEDNKDLLLEKWAARVLADPDLPIAPKLSPPALYDHFPEIVTRLAVTLRTLDDHPEALGRLVGSTAEAEAHISQRVEAEYSVPEVLRELSHLRLAIIDLCEGAEGAVPNGASAAILHAAFDQMMINAADELSGIVLEGRERAEALANERNVLYERERDARQACEEAHRAKDQFLAMVSHELRTPLNAITGWAEMLERKPNDVHLRERAIATIQRNANVQARLIDGLLDISRLRSGRVSFQRVPVDVAGLLRSSIESFTPAFAEKKLRVDLSLLPIESTAMGDEERLRQVFTNLLGNAIKFTPEGGTVRVSMEGSADLVRVEVSDSGVGIPSDFLPHVFEPFRQADSSWTRDHSGLGLGLAIAKAIVDLHGGTIEPVSNGHGEGATFRIALPATTKEKCAKDGTNGPSTQSTQSASSRLEHPLWGVRVIVVDDDEDARSLATAMLLDQGCDVREAGCAPEAYELFENFQPHVLVTDLAMPGEDGVSLLRRVRKQYGPVPAIALSAFSGPSEIRTITAGGFERHIVKPAALSDLVSAIEDLVLRSSRAQPRSMSVDESARRSVLVVEDDMAIAIELAELLREEGFAVRLASNGSEAWQQLDQGFRPNVIVLDLMMPVMDGWTLRRKLLGEPRLASIPVVVLSGVSAQDAAKVERVDDVLSKPFDFRTLLKILDRHAANSPLTKRAG